MTPLRTVIQIQGVAGALCALCDDGSIWQYMGMAGWIEIKPPPQPCEVGEEKPSGLIG